MTHATIVFVLAFALAPLVGCGGRGANNAKATSSGSDSADVAPATPPSAASPSTGVPPRAADPRIARADGARIKGRADAKVWVIVVSDFQCPYCRQWEQETAPQVDKEFVETGTARVAFINYPLQQHANALPAAEAAMCAGAQGKFWEMHDRLFDTQEQWTPNAQPAGFFETLAQGSGADVPLFRQCVKDQVMRPLIEADYQRAATSGAESTPTFLIGNMTFPGAQKIDVFRMAISQALAGGIK